MLAAKTDGWVSDGDFWVVTYVKKDKLWRLFCNIYK